MTPIWYRRYCQRVPQSEELSGSVTIKRTTRQCNIQRHIREVSKSKVPQSCVLLSRECYNLKYMKEYRNQKYCQGVSQFKYLELISSLWSDGGYHFRGSK